MTQHNPKLRVGILLDDYRAAAWSLEMFEQIMQSDSAEIVLIVLNNNEKEPVSNDTLLSKIVNNRHRLGYLVVRKFLEVAYTKLVERSVYLPDANEVKNSETLLQGIPSLKVKTKRGKWSDYFHDEDVRQIQDQEIDVLIRCGFGILRGEILNSAKYGIWSYHHGDNNVNRGGPAGFWESMQSWPQTGSILQILTEDLDNGQILYRSYSCTEVFSVQDNQSNYYWKTLLFIPRKLKELHRLGAERFFARVASENRHPSFYSDRLYTSPTNKELAGLTFSKIVEKAKHLYTNRYFLDQWILMFHLKSELSSSFWRYNKIFPPLDRFWADPHIIKKDNVYYVFIEEFLYSTDKGHISVLTIDETGNYSQPEIVLDKPYHLSYPFIFEHKDQYYMIPESMDNGTVELYKCTEFPNKWEFQMNLMENIKAVDTTLHFHNGKWWIFTNTIENDGVSGWDELFVYFADDLFASDWTPHPENPVLSDCNRARSAGKLFIDNDTLYRPSQNCSTRYGYGFNISEIITLNETQYEEKTVSTVEPNWDKNILGTHTFNRTGNLHIIDAIYRRRKNGKRSPS